MQTKGHITMYILHYSFVMYPFNKVRSSYSETQFSLYNINSKIIYVYPFYKVRSSYNIQDAPLLLGDRCYLTILNDHNQPLLSISNLLIEHVLFIYTVVEGPGDANLGYDDILAMYQQYSKFTFLSMLYMFIL